MIPSSGQANLFKIDLDIDKDKNTFEDPSRNNGIREESKQTEDSLHQTSEANHLNSEEGGVVKCENELRNPEEAVFRTNRFDLIKIESLVPLDLPISLPVSKVKPKLPPRMISPNGKHFKTYGNQPWGDTMKAGTRKEYAHFGETSGNVGGWGCWGPDDKAIAPPFEYSGLILEQVMEGVEMPNHVSPDICSNAKSIKLFNTY